MSAAYRDDDPPPSKSPRRYADVGAIPHARRLCHVIGGKTTEAKLRRLRLISIVYACRERPDPVPNSTLVAVLGISEDSIARYHKLGRKWNLRRARV